MWTALRLILVTDFLGACSANQILGTHTQTDGVQRGVLEGVKSSQTDAEQTSITKKAKPLLSSVHHTLLFSYLSYHSSWIFAAAPTTPRFPFLVCLLLSSSAAVLDKCLSFHSPHLEICLTGSSLLPPCLPFVCLDLNSSCHVYGWLFTSCHVWNPTDTHMLTHHPPLSSSLFFYPYPSVPFNSSLLCVWHPPGKLWMALICCSWTSEIHPRAESAGMHKCTHTHTVHAHRDTDKYIKSPERIN